MKQLRKYFSELHINKNRRIVSDMQTKKKYNLDEKVRRTILPMVV